MVVLVIIAFVAGALIMLTGIYFGLKWKQQLEKQEPVTMPDVKLPTREKEVSSLPDLTPSIIEEWFEGEQKEGDRK